MTLDEDKRVVALEYNGSGAPKVTAKGQGLIAEEILRLAAENHIPITESPELTLLLSTIDLGEEIPHELYVAVAEVLCFAYRLSGKQAPLQVATN